MCITSVRSEGDVTKNNVFCSFNIYIALSTPASALTHGTMIHYDGISADLSSLCSHMPKAEGPPAVLQQTKRRLITQVAPSWTAIL